MDQKIEAGELDICHERSRRLTAHRTCGTSLHPAGVGFAPPPLFPVWAERQLSRGANV